MLKWTCAGALFKVHSRAPIIYWWHQGVLGFAPKEGKESDECDFSGSAGISVWWWLDWFGRRPSVQNAFMGFSQMVETVTCCSAGTSSSAESFTALLARPEFSLSSTIIFKLYILLCSGWGLAVTIVRNCLKIPSTLNVARSHKFVRLKIVLMIFWNCPERKWLAEDKTGNSNFSRVGSLGSAR